MAITGGMRTKAIAKRYPVDDGLIAETTKQTGHIENLIAEQGSNVAKRYKEGL